MGENEKDADQGVQAVPPFVMIVSAASHAFGRADGEFASTDVLYGLDADGRVWEWCRADPDWEDSADGWTLLPNKIYREGKEPPQQRKTR